MVDSIRITLWETVVRYFLPRSRGMCRCLRNDHRAKHYKGTASYVKWKVVSRPMKFRNWHLQPEEYDFSAAI